MTDIDRKKLLRLQARRRGHLKAALRKYAKVFNMSWWFTTKNPGAEASVPRDRLDNHPNNLPKLADFEECGTACCLAGLDYMRSGRSLEEQVEFYGFQMHVFFADRWPEDILKGYQIGRATNDHSEMVVAAEKAIDFFTVK